MSVLGEWTMEAVMWHHGSMAAWDDNDGLGEETRRIRDSIDPIYRASQRRYLALRERMGSPVKDLDRFWRVAQIQDAARPETEAEIRRIIAEAKGRGADPLAELSRSEKSGELKILRSATWRLIKELNALVEF